MKNKTFILYVISIILNFQFFELLAGDQSNLSSKEKFASLLNIKNGYNEINFLAGVKKSMVFVARRDNFNGHGYSLISFYVYASSIGETNDKYWQLVPFFDGEKENDTLGTIEGAECVLRDIRLVRDPVEGDVSVIVAQRELGESYASAAPVRFDVYKIENNLKGIPGYPLYSFQKKKSMMADKIYCDVNEAFAKELGLGGDGLRQK